MRERFKFQKLLLIAIGFGLVFLGYSWSGLNLFSNTGNKKVPIAAQSRVVAEGNVITVIVDNSAGVKYLLTTTDELPIAENPNWQDSNIFAVTGDGKYYVWVKDETGNIKQYLAFVNASDGVKPVINSITVDDKSLTVLASDNDRVSGYYVSKTNELPDIMSEEWQTANTYSVSDYGKYYVFVRDVAGNISDVYEINVVKPDKTAPLITNVLVIDKNITVTAEDDGTIIGYYFSQEATTPLSTDAGWLASNVYTATIDGTYYIWVVDSTGKVSENAYIVKVDTTDTVAPTIKNVEVNNKDLSVLAQDNVQVLEYFLKNNKDVMPNLSDAGWQASSIFTVNDYGTYYVWVRDAKGNISEAFEVNVVEPDYKAPEFSDPAITYDAKTKSLTVNAKDNVKVVGYILTVNETGTSLTDSNWQESNVLIAPEYGTYYVWVKDAAGNFNVIKFEAVAPDTTSPVILSVEYDKAKDKTFTVNAKDNVAVTGYIITNTNAIPSLSDSGWKTEGTYTLPAYGVYYAWVKDADGNISAFQEVNLKDYIAPVISAAKTVENQNKVTITATDNVKVTSYLLTTNNVVPNAKDSKWGNSNILSVSSQGTYYVWAKDAAGNISKSMKAVFVDTQAPQIVAIDVNYNMVYVKAIDNFNVTGYYMGLNQSSPAATSVWNNQPTLAGSVSMTYFVYVKDAAGNISSMRPAILDGRSSSPVISTVTVDAKTKLFTITASDVLNITGYKVTTSSVAPKSTDSGWSASNKVTVVDFKYDTIYYIWVKDELGYVNITKFTKVINSPTIVLDKFPPEIISVTNVADKTILIIADDDLAVTHYMVTTTSTAPSAIDSKWQVSNIIKDLSYRTYYVWAKDATGKISNYRSVTISNSTTTADTQLPLINSAIANGDKILVTASDNIGVTGYIATTTSTKPSATATGWQASNVITLSTNAKYYVWAKDAAGNISNYKLVSPKIASVTATPGAYLNETTRALKLTINANDDLAVTGYYVSTSSVKPSATATGWETSNIYNGIDAETYYIWVKDADGNISDYYMEGELDTTSPTISSAVASGMKITVTASDNLGVTGYIATTSSTKPSATATGWTTSNVITVTTYTTYYVWVKDAAGNVSASNTIKSFDGVAPKISTAIATANKTVTVTATDTGYGVTGYMVTTTTTKPSATATGWQASNVITLSTNAKYYVWTKDAAGNVSAYALVTPKIASVTTTLGAYLDDTTRVLKLTIFANDDLAVTGYYISTSSVKPSATATGWQTSNIYSGMDIETYYVWVKDADGHISDYNVVN